MLARVRQSHALLPRKASEWPQGNPIRFYVITDVGEGYGRESDDDLSFSYAYFRGQLRLFGSQSVLNPSFP